MRRARVDIRVRVDEKATWERWADDLGVSYSDLIRTAVPYYVSERKRSRREKSASESPRGTAEAGVPG